MSVLTFEDVHVHYGKEEILHGVSLEVPEGIITGVIGQNGCGKSTLVKSVFGIAPITGGKIFLDGTQTEKISRKELASRIGYVGQETSTAFDFTVEDIVRMALYRRRLKNADVKKIIYDAMRQLHVDQYAKRNIQTLSGGEKKMVFLARCAAQGASTIILDEPTNHLDIRHELFLMNYLKASGKTILLVIHDLRLAAHYCDRLCLMKEGRIVCTGRPDEVLTPDNVKNVFGIRGFAIDLPEGGTDFAIDYEKSRGWDMKSD